MAATTFADTWLEPATHYRKRHRTSGAGRRTLGEKGVGRFAAAKLTEELSLVSRTFGDQELQVNLDWGAFDDEDAFLDEIEIGWSEDTPDVFGADGRAFGQRRLTHDTPAGPPAQAGVSGADPGVNVSNEQTAVETA